MVTNRVGSPVRLDDFFGRDPFVELLWEKLDAGNVLLAAPRRFGKTSVMYRLMDRPREGYKFIHADLEYMAQPAELITELAVQLARAKDGKLSQIARGLSYLSQSAWSGVRNTIDEVELVNVKLKLREELKPRWQESGEELFKKIAQLETPLIFVLDEFPMMIDRMARSETHRQEAKTLLHWLRALRQSPDVQGVRFLIAGSIGIGRVLNELGEINSINDFEQVRLEPFTQKIAFAFLGELAKSQKLILTDQSKRKMLELIGAPVPYFIQIIFSEVAKAHRLDAETITPGKIAQIYRDKVLGVDCKTYFDHYYGRLRDFYEPREERAVKRILRELATADSLTRDACFQLYRETMGERAELEEFNLTMSDLETDFYVRFDFDARRYEFACKLLRDWWLRHYGMSTDA
jgi:AAA+ ATPase superfamily predicted ATPase